MSKKKTAGISKLQEEIIKLKEAGGFPYEWKDGGELCLFLASLHPMLIFADGIAVHNLLGYKYRKKKGTKTLHQYERFVVTAEEAKALVESAAFKVQKTRILKEDFGDLRKKNADMAMMLIHYKILDGDNEMAKVALNMDNRWISASKQVKEEKATNVDEIAKATFELIKTDEMKKKIKKLHGNH